MFYFGKFWGGGGNNNDISMADSSMLTDNGSMEMHDESMQEMMSVAQRGSTSVAPSVAPSVAGAMEPPKPQEMQKMIVKKMLETEELCCQIIYRDGSQDVVAFSLLDEFLNSDHIRGAPRELSILDVHISEQVVAKLAEVKKDRLIGMDLRLVNVDFVGLTAPSFRTLFNNVLLPRRLEFHDTALPFYVSTSSLFRLVAVQISTSLSLSPSAHIAMDPVFPIDHIDPEVLLDYLHQGSANVVRCLSIADKHIEMGVKAFIKMVVKKFLKDRMLPVYELSILCAGTYNKRDMPEMQCIRNPKTGQWLKLDAADKSLYAEYPHYLPFFVLKLKREVIQ